MHTKLSSAQLKAISKGQLLGKYGSAISAELAAGAILFAASLLCSALTDRSTAAGLVISYLIMLILELLDGIFTVGLTRFYLNLVCSRPYPVADVFYGFRVHADKAIIIRFLLSLMQFLCILPSILCSFVYARTESAVAFLFCSITIVCGCIGIVVLSLIYSQVYYIMLDFPAYTAKQIMRTSRNVMKGHKARLFYLGVTLIPYYLLSFLSCGIALFWVIPFQKTLLTNFYLDLMHRDYTV